MFFYITPWHSLTKPLKDYLNPQENIPMLVFSIFIRIQLIIGSMKLHVNL